MNLTFIQDYSTDIRLDDELMGVPDSGMYWNQGVHPLINIANLLAFLPYEDFRIDFYSGSKEYSKYDVDYLVSNLVSYNGVLYQSLTNANEDNTPNSSPTNWLPTNLDSIRLKIFLKSVERNMTGALQMNRKTLESQYIYHVGESAQVLPNDYAAWVIEPKGSDYVTIRINELALQATATGSVDVYVINQGRLVDILPLTVDGGQLVFEPVNYEISGYGKFIFAFDAQEVLSDTIYNDPLKYNSFVIYPANGTGASPESADYSYASSSNGLNFNISSYLDSSKYINNNLIDLGDMLRMQFEYDTLRMFLTNSNNISEGRERNITGDERTMRLLGAETLDTQTFTVAQKYKSKLKETKESINKTLDRFLKVPSKFKVKRRTLG
jgi:hypothetical protein